MSVYLAVDAGGTKTDCLIADDERVLATLTGESVHPDIVSAPEATVRLRHILEELSGRARIPIYLTTRACIGITGLATDGVRAWVRETLGELLVGEPIVTGDEEIALEAAFGDGPGVLVLAGAGSHVVGRLSNGTRMTAGGWGPVLGDEGSGHWIGLEGTRSGLRALYRGVPGCLLREIQAEWQLPNIGALLAKANGTPRPDFAALAVVVARCAAQGDALAQSVLERAGDELAAQVGVVLSKMRAAGCDPKDLRRVAFEGQVLSRIPRVYGAMLTALHRSHPAIKVDETATEALQGALARARRS